MKEEKAGPGHQGNDRSKAKRTMDWEGFGKRLRQRRLELGWSQEDLGNKAIVSANTVSDLERGRHIPNAHTFTNVVTALGWDLTTAIHDL